jgi:hypothetical protein
MPYYLDFFAVRLCVLIENTNRAILSCGSIYITENFPIYWNNIWKFHVTNMQRNYWLCIYRFATRSSESWKDYLPLADLDIKIA